MTTASLDLPPQLRARQVAAACGGVHVKTVYTWAREGVLPPPLRLGRLLLWDAEVIRAFLARQEDPTDDA